MFLVASRKTFRNWKSSKNYQKIICRKINSKISSMYTKQNWYHPYITFIVTNVVIFDRKYRGPTLAYRVSLKVCCVSESVERSWTVLNKHTLSVFLKFRRIPISSFSTRTNLFEMFEILKVFDLEIFVMRRHCHDFVFLTNLKGITYLLLRIWTIELNLTENQEFRSNKNTGCLKKYGS